MNGSYPRSNGALSNIFCTSALTFSSTSSILTPSQSFMNVYESWIYGTGLPRKLMLWIMSQYANISLSKSSITPATICSGPLLWILLPMIFSAPPCALAKLSLTTTLFTSSNTSAEPLMNRILNISKNSLSTQMFSTGTTSPSSLVGLSKIS